MPDPTPPTPEPDKRPWYVRLLPTNWRALVAWAAVALVTYGVNQCRVRNGDEPLPIPEPPIPIFPTDPFGWRPPTEQERQETLDILPVRHFADTEAGQGGHGAGPEDDAPVWRSYAVATGNPYPAQDQGSVGSCVSFGTSAAGEFTLAFQIRSKRGPPQQFAHVVREAVYGGSRVNVNGGRVPFSGDGSTGAWASKWLAQGRGGLLPRGTYGSLDLSAYSVQRCREWGNRGVPAELVPVCQQNPCVTTLCQTADECRTALQQGYCIFVCSDVGFGELSRPIPRDADGFLRPAGSWAHCMAIIGYQGGPRKGFLILNSWGERWVTGPVGKFADIPPGSFWADYSTVNRMLSQRDSYAVSTVGGFKRRRVAPEDWIVAAPTKRPPVAFAPGGFYVLAP